MNPIFQKDNQTVMNSDTNTQKMNEFSMNGFSLRLCVFAPLR